MLEKNKIVEIVNSGEGTAYATINGNVEEMFTAEDINAYKNIKMTEVKTLKSRATQYKECGWSGSGNLYITETTSIFEKNKLNFIKGEKDLYFDLIIKPNWYSEQTILKNVNLNEIFISDEQINFTFEDIEINC